MRHVRVAFAIAVFIGVPVVGCGSSDGGSTYSPNGDDAGLGGDSPIGTFGGEAGNGQSCVPKSCADLGFGCGPQGDGCGNLIQCGDCPSGQYCGGGGPSKCGIGSSPDGGGTGPCTPKTCGDLNATCGQQGDGCGAVLDCGSCTAPQFCGGAGFNHCGQGGADGGQVCTPKTCVDLGAGCGKQGDGCGNLVDCGTCASPAYCGGGGPNQCGLPDGGGSACTPKTCADLGVQCGTQGDGCGNTLDCGTCVAPAFCGGNGPNKCGQGGTDGGSTCVPKTCTDLGAQCGSQGDGCGGTINCGSCISPAFCGGAGANKCGQGGADGGSACVPKTCAQLGVQCGAQGDGCGNTLDCGTCVSPQFCGGNGPNKCGLGGADGGSTCVPKTCAQLGATCGTQGDGCGNTLDCGTCVSPQFCGGAGPNNCGLGAVDGGSTCVPKTCAQLGATCGQQGDGCGNILNCGTCVSPQFCGGAGANQCGLGGVDGGSLCTPKTCADLGANCGTQGDGCGGTLNCGSCISPQFCGGAGPDKCGLGGADGGAVCTPKTCQQLGFNCGPAGDGCGGLIPNCGTCTSPDICGAVSPGVCGAGQIQTDAGVFVTCDGGGSTTISGTVLAGTNPALGYGNPDPVYNAYVYIPSGPVQPITTGATCDQCTTPQSAVVSAVTGVDGKFTLTNPPTGANVPLVIQLGKWRRVLNINVTACQNNALTSDQTRLPRNRTEGNIPRFAISTGNVDVMECVLRKMGIEDTEFVNPAISAGVPTAAGRVHLYRPTDGGGGARIDKNTPAESNLIGSQTVLNAYDLILFPCEGNRYTEANADVDRVTQYANIGGRIFTTHFSYVWLWNRAPFSSTANWTVDNGSYPGPLTGYIDQTFPKGQALAQWLMIAGASTTLGQIPVNVVRNDFSGVVAPSQRWVYTQAPDPAMPIHYTFNTPVGTPPAQQCGRVVYSDFHVENSGGSSNINFPTECNAAAPLTPQEKLLEFMLFDLSSCISQDVPTCTPKTCAQVGASCGQQGDGCGGILNCGVCTAPATCGGGGTPNQCGTPTCTALTCGQQNIACGPAGDGCGGSLACGSCPSGQTCGGGGTAGQCGIGSCTPKTCLQQGIQCGPAGDGCGGSLACGGCVAPDTCGGGGTPGVCGHATCTPTTCGALGVTCGTAGDGCGGTLNCGTCTPPDTCGGGGVAGKCGHQTCTPQTCQAQNISCGPAGDGCGNGISCGNCTLPATCGGGGVSGQCGTGSCAPLTCQQQSIGCGPAGNGCGGTLDCGTCVAPQTCGGGGVAGQCGKPSCTPLTCQQQGFNCGPAGNGCGGQLDCGTCVAPQTCGGGGAPGVCGTGGGCVKLTCQQQNLNCGPAGDGCGGLLDCGTCVAPDTCGGGGTPGQCGHAACTPKTCVALNLTCGPAGDGCGGLLNCGSCTGADTCGGGGVPGQCGHPACTPSTCQQQGIQCGPAGDGCGGALDCGGCAPPQSCGGGGVPGVCGGNVVK